MKRIQAVMQLKYLYPVLSDPLLLFPHPGLFLLHLPQPFPTFLVALLFPLHQLFILQLHFLRQFCCSLCRFRFHTLPWEESRKDGDNASCVARFFLTCFIVTADVIVLPCLLPAGKRQLCSFNSGIGSQVYK